MKFAAIATAIALAATTTHGEPCDFGKIAGDLGPIVGPASLCQAATGYTIIPPVALPTADQVKAICSKCADLVASTKTITFPTCTLPVAGQEIALDKLINQVTGQCGATTEGANATTTAPPAATTAAPEATTVAPAKEESSAAGSKAGSNDVAEEVTKPAETKPAAATPAPTTSASATATLGVAVAVACSVAAFVL